MRRPQVPALVSSTGLIVVLFYLLTQIPPVAAARIQWCMRVVPNGEIVTRYGGNWCRR